MISSGDSGVYVDTRVARGFPLGGIGTDGICFNTDGSFGELRCNNNWMCPIPPPRAAFHALRVRQAREVRTVIPRRAGPTPEYAGLPNVRSTRFTGLLPAFTLAYDDDLPLRLRLDGFSPHVPHDLREGPNTWARPASEQDDGDSLRRSTRHNGAHGCSGAHGRRAPDRCGRRR